MSESLSVIEPGGQVRSLWSLLFENLLPVFRPTSSPPDILYILLNYKSNFEKFNERVNRSGHEERATSLIYCWSVVRLVAGYLCLSGGRRLL